MRLRLLLLFFFIGLSGTLVAQKAYKPIRTALKSKNAKQALTLIAPLMKDSDYRDDSRLYEYALQAHLLQHEAENTKAYLKQRYDTVAFFKSSLDIVQDILTLDSLDKVQDKEKKVALQYLETAHRFLPHINSAGRFFLQKKQYAIAISYFQTYLSTPSYLLPKVSTKRITETAYLCTKSLLLNQQYQEVPRYSHLLLQDSTYHCATLECYSLATEALHDSIAYLNHLHQGVATCSGTAFFFTRLVDYYIANKASKRALELADSLLAIDTMNIIVMEGRCLALMSEQKYNETIKQAQRILSIDSTAIYPLYYIGASYCNLANDISIVSNINSRQFKLAERKRKALYQTALPYLEKFKAAVPEQKKMWAPLLYKVYLSIENETQFKEMDALLQSL